MAMTAFLMEKNSRYEGAIFMPTIASDDEDHRTDHQAAEAYAKLLFAHVLLPGPSATCRHRNVPKRPSSFRLSQMKNALPTMFASGTNPQTRLSLELSLLSPIMK